jgi:hypothetical protein
LPPDPQFVHVQSDRVPHGDVELREGTPVHARDGHVGSVKTVVVTDNVITHFVLEGGHIGSHYELTLPVAAVDYGDPEGIHLKLSKAALHGLPGMPASKGQKHERLELVAKLFDTLDGAHAAHEYLNEQARQPGKTIRVREAAELVRDADGNARIVQSSQPSAVKGGAVGAAAGGLLTLLGPIGLAAGVVVGAGVGAVAGPRMDKGFPDAFLSGSKPAQPGPIGVDRAREHDFAEDLSNPGRRGSRVQRSADRRHPGAGDGRGDTRRDREQVLNRFRLWCAQRAGWLITVWIGCVLFGAAVGFDVLWKLGFG